MRPIKTTLITIGLVLLAILPTRISASTGQLVGWLNLNSIPTSIASQSLFVYNSKVYVIGGSNFGVPEIGYYSNIETDGLLSDWSGLTQPPAPLYWHSYASKDNLFYLLGGTDSSIHNTSSVSFGKIDPSTNIVVWQAVTPLPQTLALGASVIVGNKLYFAGGNPTPTYGISLATNQNIYFADINPNGTIGSWGIAGTLPTRLIGFGMIEINNYLYVFGGNGPTGYSSNVSRAKVNPDGSVDTNWETLSPLPIPIWRFGITRSGNMIITAGGQTNGDSIVNSVYYAALNPDGTLSNWTTGPSLPFPNCCSPLVSSGNFIYLIGGHDGGNYTDRVLKAEILSSVTPSPSATPTPTPSPTPSPTPTQSPTPTSSPTNTPMPVKRVFLIPGLGASWNVDAFIKCKDSGYIGGWTLAPYAKSYYSEILSQLPVHGWNTHPFYYDWRQDVRDNAVELTSFINSSSLPDEKVNVVGHSMGGLIGRNYIETKSGGKTNKFLAVGAPFQGSALSYPILFDSHMWTDNVLDLPEKIATTLQIYHCGIPESLQNLLPTYDYLRNSSTKQLIDTTTLKIKNNYLPTNFSSPFWGVKVGTLAGVGKPTLNIISVKPDPKWPNGKPVGKEYTTQGDGTVLLSSSQIPGADSNQTINESHTGIIASTEGVNKILEFLGSPGITDPPYSDPKSALILIGHPATFWLKDKNNATTQSEEGMIAILNPIDGDYQLQISPQSENTQFIAAQFLANGKILYKEYKFKGLISEPKIVRINSKNPTDDIVRNMHDFKKPTFPKFWHEFWNYWGKHH